MITYILPGNQQNLLIEGPVIETFNKFRQKNSTQKEAGGQLFADITERTVTVKMATGPHQKDYRRRFHFFPNQIRLRNEIKKYFKKGLHYVGDWHTHPQYSPFPSSLDIESMKRCFRKSKHELEHFILIIVGQKTDCESLWVGLINNSILIDLAPYKT